MMAMAPEPPSHAAFLLPNVGGGGAERLTIDLMAGFVARGARVDLVVQRPGGEFRHLVPPDVRIFDLDAPRLRDVAIPLRRYLKRERPGALLAAMWPLTSVAVVAGAGLPTRIAVSDHCALRQQYAGQPGTLAALRLSMAATYRFANAVIAVSSGVADEVASLAGLDRARVSTIFNPIPLPLRSGLAPDARWQDAPRPRILAMGTLKGQKNHALLIEAFARLGQSGTLAIVGVGELRGALEAQIARLGLGGRVLLPGFTATPGDWYAGADLFALSSDYEGFGNVLVEAMHFGLPVVATDCPSGPAEVLGNGRWGRLVPPGDAGRLADAMRAALTARGDPEAQRARAAEYSVDRAVRAYADLVLR